jgi:hypothetical protein
LVGYALEGEPVKLVEQYTLACPSCGGDNNWLHHERVTVFCRGHEDNDSAHVTSVDMTEATSMSRTSDNTDNPSGRRDGLRIEFSCETCDIRPKLVIFQHKGNTYIFWEDTVSTS